MTASDIDELVTRWLGECTDGRFHKDTIAILKSYTRWLASNEIDRLQTELAALRSAQQWRGIESERVTQADTEAANEAWERACFSALSRRPIIKEPDPAETPVGQIGAIISKIRQAAYAAGVAAERERCAGIAADNVITADDDVQAAYAQCAIDIESAIRSGQ